MLRRPQQLKVMAWIWTCLFLLVAHVHQQALGVTVNCLWERYFLVGGNVSGACHVSLAQQGCGSQSLRLTVAGETVLAHRYVNDSAHFTVPAPANGTLHLRCELTCVGLGPLPYCDITLRGGYPPSPPSRPKCLIPYDDTDIHCTWDPGERPLLPVNYILHWKQHSSSERGVEAGVTSAVIPRVNFTHGTMQVWVVARNLLGFAESERLDIDTLDIEQPLVPKITHHSVQPLEIFWDLECDPSLHMTENSDRSCEVQYRMRDEQAWTEGDDDAQDSFLLLDPEPFSEYDFRVRCACFGKEAVKSTWSHIYPVQSSESAPAGKLDVWTDCEDDSDEQLECFVVWKKPPLSVARGRVLGYLVTVEHNPGNVAVMNLSAEELGATERMGGCWGAQCFRLPISLRGVTGVCLTAYTSQGATDPAPLALPAPEGPQLLVSGGFAVAKEGRSFNVSWAPPSHLTGDVQYVVQLKEVETQAFNWMKLNGNQRSVIVTGDFRNYTPYNISLFSVIANRCCLLGSVITYTVQGVPPKVTGFHVSQISISEVTLSWELPLSQWRGVILCYRLGQGNHTEYNVSGDSSSLLISGLQPGQEYHVWICAESEAGQGPKEYLRFMTTGTSEYVYSVLSIPIVVALGLILLLFSCRQHGIHSLKQLRCCVKVPDPANSQLFRRPLCSCSSWTGFFSVAESIQTLPYLEVSEWEDLEDSGCQERMSLCDRQRYGQVEEGLKRMERESAEDEAEEEWTETLGKGGLELSSRGEDYSKMIDTQGDEECVFLSPTETQDFFSGYEKHFMPNPLEV
ncbi:granulocyte colony-stimulating factor receptor-like isoform X1 [Anguilla rostrata]|uniref:granulocyte colony-stimulating factor receptor-like isoform X1 n=2 Tax=Anguilla rostrata TaxID=7938 RepID=UPI0030D5C5E0